MPEIRLQCGKWHKDIISKKGMTAANEELTPINTERHLLKNNKTQLLKDFGGTQHQPVISMGGWKETKHMC